MSVYGLPERTPVTPVLVVALTIWNQSRQQPAEVKDALASVIHNRAQLVPLQPRSAADPDPVAARVAAVCMHPIQFDTFKLGAEALIDRVLETMGTNMEQAINWFRVYHLAKDLCAGAFESKGPWTRFHRVNVVPSWCAQMREPVTVGELTFWSPKAQPLTVERDGKILG